MPEPLFEKPLPVHMNLGSYPGDHIQDVIGWAKATREEDGKIQLVIDLDEAVSARLNDLAAIFELKALGFAGIKTKPKES